MTTTEQRPYTDADVDRYARLAVGIAGMEPHPDCLAIVRTVLAGLAKDGRLLPTGARRCDALCRDVEEDRDRLAVQVAAAYRYADELRSADRWDNGAAIAYGRQLREALDRAGAAPVADPAA